MDDESRAFLRRTTLGGPLPWGTRVRVTGLLPDDPDPLPIGATGTVIGGNGGQLRTCWDNGRSLMLLADDPFDVVGVDIDEFVKEVHRSTPGLRKLQLTRHSGGHLVLGMIWVHREDRRRGIAELVMKLITELADVHGLVLSANVSPPESERPRTKVTPLRHWLGRHGFWLNRDRRRRADISERFYRLPRTPGQVTGPSGPCVSCRMVTLTGLAFVGDVEFASAGLFRLGVAPADVEQVLAAALSRVTALPAKAELPVVVRVCRTCGDRADLGVGLWPDVPLHTRTGGEQ
ncbi:hypothetical protein [Amycolatopsis sp. CA-126428]|uniref:hypothetical protein n=1 Tax=Amycolatopsis sp. CA-126428 TaxID=2073158 RepID=UPI000CD16080|nr:hypothetical protein [Amycolatopsis sp. CA-126428]